jgi:hypothetical protein
LGEHDQTMLHGEDTHEDIHDDGRTLSYIEYGAGAGADHDAYHNPDAYFDKSVFRYCNDKLIPDTVHILGVGLRCIGATSGEAAAHWRS